MTILFKVIVSVLLAVFGFFAGMLCCAILNKIPAAWLCDYDEEPSQELLSGNRFNIKKNGSLLGAFLGVTLAAMFLTNGATLLLVFEVIMCFALALVSAADAKYTIIPDQFTIAAAVIAVITAVVDILTDQVFIKTWYDPLLGCLAGAGCLIILDIFSTLVLKKEGFGFGDIKLLAAMGLMFGWKYSLVLIIIASLVAAVHFLILIFAGNGKIEEGKYLPMAPYLCIGAAITIIASPWLQVLFNLYRSVLDMDVLP